MDAEALIAALEACEDVAVSSTELDGVVELSVRHTGKFGRREDVTVAGGVACWSGYAAPIKAGPGEDGDDPQVIARVIFNVIAPRPPLFRTSGGSAYL